MIQIDQADWLSDVFSRARLLSDLIREPIEDFSTLTAEARDQLRQSQVWESEAVRVLGYFRNFGLVMKWDKTLGWLPKGILDTAEKADFTPPRLPVLEPLQFLESWRGVPYLWGGLSTSGIDCSGLSQLYFLQVHHRVLPKNSRNQRQLLKTRTTELTELRDHDLIFCHRLGAIVHHVAIFFGGWIWHSRTDGGVTAQTPDEFLALYEVEAAGSLDLAP